MATRNKRNPLQREPDEPLEVWVPRANAQGWNKKAFCKTVLKAQKARILDAEKGQQTLPLGRPSSTALFKFIDLFAGIGGFRIGMTLNGGECVYTSERDKFARMTYSHWFGEREEHIKGDINDLVLEGIPDHDVLCAGFPCQPFSLAGVSKKNSLGRAHGFDDATQGNLFFRIMDILHEKKPPVVFLENVRNLKSHDKRETWKEIHKQLVAAGYTVFDQIIDARSWVPQHRERIFIVGFSQEIFGPQPKFRFPKPPSRTAPVLKDILEPIPDPKYILNDHLWRYLQDYAAKHRAKGNGFGFGLVDRNGVARTLSARYHKDGAEILIRRPHGNPRRLTPREAARLMGYSEEIAERFGFKEGFPIVVSDTQAYRQFGNSVVPQVVEAIGAEIVRTMRTLPVQNVDASAPPRAISLPRPERPRTPVTR